MEAIIATAPKTLVRRKLDKPPLKPLEVIVRPKAVGICGSDIHLYRGDHPYTTYPMIFGHEASGIVESTGRDVTGFDPGDRVVIEPLIPCGSCYPCSIGRSNCCSNMQTVGVTTNGALAEAFTVPVSCLHKIPADMPYDLGALAEPFSIGFHATNRGNIKEKDRILVIGAGTIGLTILAAAKNRGAQVMITDVLDFRLDIARKMGADMVVNSKHDNLQKKAEEWTNGIGPHAVFEAVGLPQTLESAVSIVSDAGRVVVVGVTNEKFCIYGVDVTKKELSIIGSRNNLDQFKAALNYLTMHQTTARNLISNRFPFSQVEGAFEHADQNPENSCKVMVTI